jgi:hypothetical protein
MCIKIGYYIPDRSVLMEMSRFGLNYFVRKSVMWRKPKASSSSIEKERK